MKRWAWCWTLMALVTCSGRLSAQSQQTSQRAKEELANRWFEEGKQLLSQGMYREACTRFADSLRIDSGAGTVLGLALCHEGQGLWASAERYFNEAKRLALRSGRQDRLLLAEQRLSELEAKVSRLVFRLPKDGALPSGSVIRCDGNSLDIVTLRTPLGLDPGTHEVTAHLPGYPPIVRTVVIGTGASTHEIVLPDPAHEPPGPSAPAPMLRPSAGPNPSGLNPSGPNPSGPNPSEPFSNPRAAHAATVSSPSPMPAMPAAPVTSPNGTTSPQSAPPSQASPSSHSSPFQPSPMSNHPSAPTRPWIWVAGGLTAAGILTGVALGAVTLAKKGEVDRLCPDEHRCNDDRAFELNSEAYRSATWSNIGWGLGVVGAAFLVWQLVRPPESAQQPRGTVSLQVAGTGAGVQARVPW